MSVHRSLRSAGKLARHRNVLTREERLAKLENEEKWDESKSIFSLPKVRNIKKVAKKKKKVVEEGEEGAEGVAGAEGGLAAPEASTAPAAPDAGKEKK